MDWITSPLTCACAAARISGPARMYSAKRSSKVFISFVYTSAMAPEALGPTRAQSAASPSPTSTTFASMAPPVDAVPGAATARRENVSGAVAVTSAVPGTQRNGTG